MPLQHGSTPPTREYRPASPTMVCELCPVSGGVGACSDAARRDGLGEGAVQASPFTGQEALSAASCVRACRKA